MTKIVKIKTRIETEIRIKIAQRSTRARPKISIETRSAVTRIKVIRTEVTRTKTGQKITRVAPRIRIRIAIDIHHQKTSTVTRSGVMIKVRIVQRSTRARQRIKTGIRSEVMIKNGPKSTRARQRTSTAATRIGKEIATRSTRAAVAVPVLRIGNELQRRRN